MAGWEVEKALLQAEITQRQDEGCSVPHSLVDAILALPAGSVGGDEVAVQPLWEALSKLEADADLAAAEPDDLESVRVLRPDGPRRVNWAPSDGELVDRMHGAWTGRAARNPVTG